MSDNISLNVSDNITDNDGPLNHSKLAKWNASLWNRRVYKRFPYCQGDTIVVE